MDNLTHSLIGAYFGVAVGNRTLATRKERFAIIATSVVANNLPDLDLLYAHITPGPLGYILHHRGHTHTLVFAIVPIIALFFFLFAFRSRLLLSSGVTRSLLLVTGIGTLLHVLLDGFNSYGVHPFWPLSNGWIYGDTLFIIEPLIWFTFSIALYSQTSSKILRFLLLLIIALGAGLIVFSGYFQLPWALIIVAGTLLCFFLSWRFSPKKVLLYSGLIATLIVGVFAYASRAVKVSLTEIFNRSEKSETLHEIITSPHPTNPLCWNFIMVSNNKDTYRLERGVYSLTGSVSPLCNALFKVGTLADEPNVLKESDALKGLGMYSLPLSEVRSLVGQSCQVRAFLQFARAPVFKREGNRVTLSDLRFDRTKVRRRGFSQLVIEDLSAEPKACPAWLPPWSFPRTELQNERANYQ